MGRRNEEDFINLVKLAEEEAKSNIKVYNLKVILFALFGYMAIFFFVTILIGFIWGLAIIVSIEDTNFMLFIIIKKFAIAFFMLFLVILRALWVTFPAPKGYVLKKSNFPELFIEIDNLTKQLKALKVHKVLLDSSLNAGVVQCPRLGIFGWQKNYLIIGYRLLLTLSPEEMRSVLAHELGHLSSNHNRFRGWIYRIRVTWLQLMDELEQAEASSTIFFRKFFQWYSPKFEAYSFILARHNEYEADNIAATLTSPYIAASSLISAYVSAPLLDMKYWNSYLKRAEEEAEPSYSPYNGLTDFLKKSILTTEELQDTLDKEMSIETHYNDTHPSLKDRLSALGVTAQIPRIPNVNAANIWLKNHLEEINQYFSLNWEKENLESWKQRYEYITNSKLQLEKFSEQPIDNLNNEELWNYAWLTKELKSGEDALHLFVAYIQRNQNDPDAAYLIGTTLLEQKDSEGLEYLKIARKSDHYLEQSANIGFNYLKEQQKEEEAEFWWQECVEENNIFIAANKERNSLTLEDEFVFPYIDKALLQQIIQILKKHTKIRKAWLAEKKLQHFSEDRVYVIAFTSRTFFFKKELQVELAEDIGSINIRFFVISNMKSIRLLHTKICNIGERIK
ncbi:M48 family metalloprotease [bacterium]|nr:M48 family metalloprotease [bacterium]MBU1883245.1 M48 family metalloprotease [bacterium]